MNTKVSSRVLSLLVAAALIAALPVLAAEQQLPAAAPSDLVATALVAPVDGPSLATEREAVRFSWNLPADQGLAAPAPFVADSRAYWIRVDASELAAGIELPITAADSLVRLQPVGSSPEAAAIDPMDLVITAPGQTEALSNGNGLDLVVDAEKLSAAGLPFAAGTSAFRFSDSGSGSYALAAPALAGAKGSYLVHVQEPNSAVALSLGADRGAYLHGETLQARLSLSGASLQGAEVFVTSPAGRVLPASVISQQGTLLAQVLLDAREPLTPGLWEVHAVARGEVKGLETLRHARTAFSVAVPTARLAPTVSLEQRVSRQGVPSVRVTVEVETIASGRYEVRGVLYGTDANGVRQPLAAAATAQWMNAGSEQTELRFERRVFRDTDLGAPFELRDLQLRDQSRMALVESRAAGLVVAD
ncbi:MAG: DUF4785 domain-containing protein [Acidobacteriota bacterium]